MRYALIVIAVAMVMVPWSAMAGGGFYADPSGINLLALRDNIASSSSPEANPDHMLYYTGSFTSFSAPGNVNAWWQVEFSKAYSVETYSFDLYGSLFSEFTYRVEVSSTGLDGSWYAPDIGAGENHWITLPKPEGSNIPGQKLTGTFVDGPVDAKFVRLCVQSYAGHSAAAIVAVPGLYGPNDIPVSSTNLSLAQSNWNHTGPVMVSVNDGASWTAYPTLNDNLGTGPDLKFGVRTSDGEDGWDYTPVRMIVTLDDLYSVSAVALTTYYAPGNVNWHATKIQILYSPDDTGEVWYEATDVLDLIGTGMYNEVTFDAVEAHRIQFVVLEYGRENFLPKQVHVFGDPIPEPATMALLAMGGLAMLRRRK
jgi:hypothetical protein